MTLVAPNWDVITYRAQPQGMYQIVMSLSTIDTTNAGIGKLFLLSRFPVAHDLE
jgi:hypothetical protein